MSLLFVFIFCFLFSFVLGCFSTWGGGFLWIFGVVLFGFVAAVFVICFSSFVVSLSLNVFLRGFEKRGGCVDFRPTRYRDCACAAVNFHYNDCRAKGGVLRWRCDGEY